MCDQRDAWQQLVARYADGRPICNCGHAYHNVSRGGCCDMRGTGAGCSANQYNVREQIAERVLAELNGGK